MCCCTIQLNFCKMLRAIFARSIIKSCMLLDEVLKEKKNQSHYIKQLFLNRELVFWPLLFISC